MAQTYRQWPTSCGFATLRPPGLKFPSITTDFNSVAPGVNIRRGGGNFLFPTEWRFGWGRALFDSRMSGWWYGSVPIPESHGLTLRHRYWMEITDFPAYDFHLEAMILNPDLFPLLYGKRTWPMWPNHPFGTSPYSSFQTITLGDQFFGRWETFGFYPVAYEDIEEDYFNPPL